MELICSGWTVRAKNYNPMACTALLWEDTDPAPASACKIHLALRQRRCLLGGDFTRQPLDLLPIEIGPCYFSDAECKASSKFRYPKKITGVITSLHPAHQQVSEDIWPCTALSQVFQGFCHSAWTLGTTCPNWASNLVANWSWLHLPVFSPPQDASGSSSPASFPHSLLPRGQ